MLWLYTVTQAMQGACQLIARLSQVLTTALDVIARSGMLLIMGVLSYHKRNVGTCLPCRYVFAKWGHNAHLCVRSVRTANAGVIDICIHEGLCDSCLLVVPIFRFLFIHHEIFNGSKPRKVYFALSIVIDTAFTPQRQYTATHAVSVKSGYGIQILPGWGTETHWCWALRMCLR